MNSEPAKTAVAEAAGRSTATGAAPQARRPLATVSAAATATASVSAARPAAESQATSMPALRRPPVVVAAAQAIPAADAQPPAETTQPERVTPVPLLRMVMGEIALMIGLLAIGREWWQVAIICAGAALLLAMAAVRIRGQWLSTLAGRWTALALRRRRHDLSSDHDGSELLDLLAPGARVTTAELAGAPSTVITRPEELLTVLRPVDAGVRDLADAVLSDALRPESDPESPESGLHLVLHRGPCRGGFTQPRVWLAVRVRRDVDVLVDDDLRVGLSNLLRKTQKKLSKAGVSVAPLNAKDITATFAALAHVGPGRETLREQWKHFCAGPVVQVGVRVTGLSELPASQRMTAVERLLATVPGVAATVAVVLGSDPADDVAVLRLAAPAPTAVEAAIDHLTTVAPHLRLQLKRLDGLHLRAIAASLPIGGVSL